MLFTGEFEIDVEFLRNVFHICDNYIFQIEKFCCISYHLQKVADFIYNFFTIHPSLSWGTILRKKGSD